MKTFVPEYELAYQAYLASRHPDWGCAPVVAKTFEFWRGIWKRADAVLEERSKAIAAMQKGY